MKHKTAELEGARLDAAVGKALGWHIEGDFWYGPTEIRGRVTRDDNPVQAQVATFHPSNAWAQGGLIIDRERINIYQHTTNPDCHAKALRWFEGKSYVVVKHYGPTPLIAAMRAYVASKLGEEVELP